MVSGTPNNTNGLKPVTDPTLLQQLNGSTGGLKPVTDPNLLNQLNGTPRPPQQQQEQLPQVKQFEQAADVALSGGNPQLPSTDTSPQNILKSFGTPTGVAPFSLSDKNLKLHPAPINVKQNASTAGIPLIPGAPRAPQPELSDEEKQKQTDEDFDKLAPAVRPIAAFNIKAYNGALDIMNNVTQLALGKPIVGESDITKNVDDFFKGFKATEPTKIEYKGGLPTLNNVGGAMGGMMPFIAAYATGVGELSGAASAAGAGDVAASTIGNVGTNMVLGYNQAYDDATNAGVKNEVAKNEYALSSTMLGGMIFSAMPALRQIKGFESPQALSQYGAKEFAKALAYGVSTKEAVNTGLEAIKQAVINNAENTGIMTGLEFSNKLSQAVSNVSTGQHNFDITLDPKEIGNTILLNAITLSPFSALKGYETYRNANPLYKQALAAAGKHPDEFTAMLGQQLADGQITQEQFESASAKIDKAAAIVKTLPKNTAPDEIGDNTAKLFDADPKTLQGIPDNLDAETKVKIAPLIEQQNDYVKKQKETNSETLKQVYQTLIDKTDADIAKIISQPKTENDALRQRSAEKKVSRPTGRGENLTGDGEGIRPSEQGTETPEILPQETPPSGAPDETGATEDVITKKKDLLLNKVNEYNTIPNTHVRRKSALNKEIAALSSELGMTIEKKENAPSNKNQYIIRQESGKQLVRQKTKADVEGNRLEDRSTETQDLFHQVKNDIVNTNPMFDSKNDHKLDVGLSQKEINKAVDNISQGKYGYNEIQLLDGLEQMQKRGQLEFVRGGGANIEKSAIPLSDLTKPSDATRVVEQMSDEELRPIDEMEVEVDDEGNIVYPQEEIDKALQNIPEESLNLYDTNEDKNLPTAAVAETKSENQSDGGNAAEKIAKHPDVIEHKRRIAEAEQKVADTKAALESKQTELSDLEKKGQQKGLFPDEAKKGELIGGEEDASYKLKKEIKGLEGDHAKAARNLEELRSDLPKVEELASKQRDLEDQIKEEKVTPTEEVKPNEDKKKEIIPIEKEESHLELNGNRLIDVPEINDLLSWGDESWAYAKTIKGLKRNIEEEMNYWRGTEVEPQAKWLLDQIEKGNIKEFKSSFHSLISDTSKAIQQDFNKGELGKLVDKTDEELSADVTGEMKRAIDAWTGLSLDEVKNQGLSGGAMSEGRLEELYKNNPSEIERYAKPIRDYLRDKYGKTITLFRSEAKDFLKRNKRELKSYSSNPLVTQKFFDKQSRDLIKEEVPIDDIVFVTNRFGQNEFIVKSETPKSDLNPPEEGKKKVTPTEEVKPKKVTDEEVAQWAKEKGLTISKKEDFDVATKMATQQPNYGMGEFIFGKENKIEERKDVHEHTYQKTGKTLKWTLGVFENSKGNKRYLLYDEKYPDQINSGAIVEKDGTVVHIRTDRDYRNVGLAQVLLREIKKDYGEIKPSEPISKEGAKALYQFEKSTPKSESGIVSRTAPESKESEVSPIRKLGTGADVYFESDKYRVNDDSKGGVLLNVTTQDSVVPALNVHFDSAKEAVDVAKILQKEFPEGLPKEFATNKYIDAIRKEGNIHEQMRQQNEKSLTDQIEPKDETEKKIIDVAEKVKDALKSKAQIELEKQGIKIQKSGVSLDDVVDTATKLIIEARRTGLAIADAVKKGIDYIRNSDAFKALTAPEQKAIEDHFHQWGLDEPKREAAKQELAAALETVKQNRPTILSKLADTRVAKIAKDIALGLNPFLAKGVSREAASIITKLKGNEGWHITQTNEQFKHMLDFWNKQKPEDRLMFILSIEDPAKYGVTDPHTLELAKAYRQRLDRAFGYIADVKDVPYWEDYFPHFWKNTKKSANIIAKMQSKAPFEGSKSFLKKRVYDTILDGMKKGLELATDNPEEMVRLAEMNAWKFKTAHDIFEEYKKQNLIQFFKNRASAPEGWKLVDDPLFTRKSYIPPDVKGDPATLAQAGGGWYMPEEGARIVNRYLSRGLLGRQDAIGAIARSIRDFNNVLNMFQLGASLFHFSTTTLDSTYTGFAIGLNQMLTGHPLDAAITWAKAGTILPRLIENMVQADKVVKQYRQGIDNENVKSLVVGNRTPGLARLYSIDSYYNFRKAWQRALYAGEYKQIPRGILSSIGMIPEIISKPLMSWFVPRLKVATYLNLVESEIARQNPKTDAEMNVIKQKVGAMIDDRLGQMVYDNIFWNKVAKDIGFLSIRSLGWSGGTVRAIGGGIADVPESMKDIVHGNGISPRTAWLMMVIGGTAMYGAMYQYLRTGQAPQQLKDYFFPKDATKNEDGTDNRVALPTYMKDLISYGNNPIQTVGHKLSPVIAWTDEMLNNKDFYGEQVYNPDDPAFKKGLEMLQFTGKQFVPFGFRQQPEENLSFTEQFTTGQGLERKFGLMPAQRQFERKDWQNEIVKEASASPYFSDDAKTEYQAEATLAKRNLRELIYNNQPFEKELDDAVAKGYIAPDYVKEFVRDASVEYYGRLFKNIEPEAQLKVLAKYPEQLSYLKDYVHTPESFDKLKREKPQIFHDNPEYDKLLKQLFGE